AAHLSLQLLDATEQGLTQAGRDLTQVGREDLLAEAAASVWLGGWDQLAFLGSLAMSVEGYGLNDPTEIIDVLISKQRDYGHSNITRYGIAGVIVRLSDKIARLNNLAARGLQPENETIQDTLVDIIGYTLIIRMLLNGTFELDLAEDQE